MMSAWAMANEQTQHALVVGLGRTGFSCVRHLLARGYDVEVVDTRDTPPLLDRFREEFPHLTLHTGPLEEGRLCAADMLVVSPGVPLHEPAIKAAMAAGVQAIGDIELFAREVRSPVFAVTGANGKSTVTTLLVEMCYRAGLDARIGGNIGVPVLDLLQENEPDVYVLELSSFQLETTVSLNARAAAVLNVTADHMDRYRDVDDYAAAKARIFFGDGVMVLNADDPRVLAMAQPDRAIVRFGLGFPQAPCDYGLVSYQGEPWLAKGEERLLAAGRIKLSGRHNLANVLAAMALAEAVNLPREALIEAAAAFTGLPHRCQLVVESRGIRWINDSKATNVGATVAALRGLERPVVWIAGGEGKGADFRELTQAVDDRTRAVVLIGRDARLIEKALRGTVAVHHAADIEAAVKQAYVLARPGDVVLLSPACASFDTFRNFEHRGEAFVAATRAITSGNRKEERT